jgi:hypothetical protein
MRSGDEMLGETLADILRRAALGQVAEVIGLREGGCGGDGEKEGKSGDFQKSVHEKVLQIA